MRFKTDAINYVFSVLNSFQKKIKLTYEVEDSDEITLLEVLILRRGNDVETTVYRKPTHNEMYLH